MHKKQDVGKTPAEQPLLTAASLEEPQLVSQQAYTPWQRFRMLLWPAWVDRNMGLLIAARVFMSAARALAGIIVPIYLAIIGFNGLELGLLFVITALASALLSSAVGVFSDRLGRKIFIIILPFFAAMAALVFAFSHVVGLLFFFAALGSFGRGAGARAGIIGPYQPAEQALLAETVPAKYRNSLFGRVAFASSLGALIGSGPFATLPELLPHFGVLGISSYQLSFLIMAVLAFIAGLLAIPVRETRPRREPQVVPGATALAGSKPRRKRQAISQQSKSILIRLWITNATNGLAVGFFGPFITYWFFRRYGVGPAQIGLLFAIINLAAMFSNLGAASFAARVGLIRAIVIGRVLQALLMIPMVLAPTFWMAGMFYLTRMLAQRLALPLRQSYVMGVVPADERGTIGALSNLPMQVTSSASPALAGYLFDHVSLALPFEIGALLQGVNAVLFFFFFRAVLPPEEQEKARVQSEKLDG